MNQELTEDNFVLYAAKIYDNSQCLTVEEFNNDMKILTYIKRLTRKYINSGSVKERLLLNHIITLQNLFTNVGACRLMIFYCDEKAYPVIKTIMLYLSTLPDSIPDIDLKSIDIDQKFLKILEEI